MCATCFAGFQLQQLSEIIRFTNHLPYSRLQREKIPHSFLGSTAISMKISPLEVCNSIMMALFEYYKCIKDPEK